MHGDWDRPMTLAILLAFVVAGDLALALAGRARPAPAAHGVEVEPLQLAPVEAAMAAGVADLAGRRGLDPRGILPEAALREAALSGGSLDGPAAEALFEAYRARIEGQLLTGAPPGTAPPLR